MFDEGRTIWLEYLIDQDYSLNEWSKHFIPDYVSPYVYGLGVLAYYKRHKVKEPFMEFIRISTLFHIVGSWLGITNFPLTGDKHTVTMNITNEDYEGAAIFLMHHCFNKQRVTIIL